MSSITRKYRLGILNSGITIIEGRTWMVPVIRGCPRKTGYQIEGV